MKSHFSPAQRAALATLPAMNTFQRDSSDTVSVQVQWARWPAVSGRHWRATLAQFSPPQETPVITPSPQLTPMSERQPEAKSVWHELNEPLLSEVMARDHEGAPRATPARSGLHMMSTAAQ